MQEVTGIWKYYKSSATGADKVEKNFTCDGSPETDFLAGLVTVTDYGATPPSYNLAACEGDCDTDSHCAGSLKCFQREFNDEIVPGCAREGYFISHDYCYDDTLPTINNPPDDCGISCSAGLGDKLKLRAKCSSGFSTVDATLTVISDQPNAFAATTTSDVEVYVKALNLKMTSIASNLEPRFLMSNVKENKANTKTYGQSW